MTTEANRKIGDWYRFVMGLIMDIPNLNHRKVLLFEQLVNYAWKYQSVWPLLANLQSYSQSKTYKKSIAGKRGNTNNY